MDRELVAFVGAGLQIVASGIVRRPPEGSIREGYQFVEHLLMFGDSGISKAIVGCATSLWSDWRRSKLPRIVAVEHIQVMPEILEMCRVEPGVVLTALVGAGATEKDASVGAFRIASLVIEKAAGEGCYEDTDLSRQLTFFFIERLMLQLLSQRNLIRDLEVPVARYFADFERRTAEGDEATARRPFGEDVLAGWKADGRDSGSEAKRAEAAICAAN